jgi:hypothetical protein
MHRHLLAIAVSAVALAGCIAEPPQPVVLVTDTYDCLPGGDRWQGELVPDSAGIGIYESSSGGATASLMWPTGFTAWRRPGGEIELRDGTGSLIATTGKRYEVEFVADLKAWARSHPGSGPQPFPVCRVTEIQ